MFRLAFLMTTLALLVGCRTSNPAMKPAKEAEQFVTPPPGRYDTPDTPREVMDRTGERTGPLADPPRSVPATGFGSPANYGKGRMGY